MIYRKIHIICRIIFAHFFVMNLVLWYKGSSAAIPFFTLVALLALWFGVSVPLTFVGAFFGFRKRAMEHPVRTNQIPRQIPDQSFYTQVNILDSIINQTKLQETSPKYSCRNMLCFRQIINLPLFQPIPGIVMGGILPFGCIFIQLFFVLSSIWSSQIYYM